jgi:hypothetical protein
MPEAGSVYAKKVSSLRSPSYVVPDKASELAECQRLSQDYSMAMPIRVMVTTLLRPSRPLLETTETRNRLVSIRPVPRSQFPRREKLRRSYCNFAYSVLASFRMGISGVTAGAPRCAVTRQTVGQNVWGRVRSQSSNPPAANPAPDMRC